MATKKRICPGCGKPFRKSGGRALVHLERLEREAVCQRCWNKADRIVTPKPASRCLECAAATPRLCLACSGRVKVQRARPRKSTPVADYLRGS